MNEKPKYPVIFVGPATRRIRKALELLPKTSITPEEAKRQTEQHLESARRRLEE